MWPSENFDGSAQLCYSMPPRIALSGQRTYSSLAVHFLCLLDKPFLEMANPHLDSIFFVRSINLEPSGEGVGLKKGLAAAVNNDNSVKPGKESARHCRIRIKHSELRAKT